MWDVQGEICCGIFANTEINAGEEVTINYSSGSGNKGVRLCGGIKCSTNLTLSTRLEFHARVVQLNAADFFLNN
ncbi:Zinc ion binding protein [Phytophthora megakarya]|uniref:Zinc ion binding protein n=1 Tax=Phytophthora megakarya TaxID=4795 RepID=A0A225UGA8_9STRA|nr:Zinc ion binding protein [Phytophthora megakarya]